MCVPHNPGKAVTSPCKLQVQQVRVRVGVCGVSAVVLQVYLGSSMMVVTADPEVARKLNYRMINRAIGRQQLRINDEDDQINNQGLVVAK